ncbi:16728_t:CDS:1, partial [Acaulospora morrowiae]
MAMIAHPLSIALPPKKCTIVPKALSRILYAIASMLVRHPVRHFSIYPILVYTSLQG